jgi:membrane-associated phospholipid phosphatase
LPVRLNFIDWLYLVYLAAVAVLALRSDATGLGVFVWHAAIALAIVLVSLNRLRSRVLNFMHDWYPLAMFIFTFEEIAHFSLSVVPHWQDWQVVGFEQRIFGESPNLWLRQFASRPLSEFMDFGYFTYYPMFPVIGGLLYGHGKQQLFRRLMYSSALMYIISFAIYLGFPCEGPRRALPGFTTPPKGYVFSWLVHLIQGGAGVHGNALPSSHVGLAVLCSLIAYRWRTGFGVLLAISAVLIPAGAVYDGYHYFSDVLAGVVVALTSYGLGSLIVNLDSKFNGQKF